MDRARRWLRHLTVQENSEELSRLQTIFGFDALRRLVAYRPAARLAAAGESLLCVDGDVE